MNFDGYKDFGGIRTATKVEVRRDAQTISAIEITEFTGLEKVDAAGFAEPK
jgi:hypothetical protein